MFLNTTLFWGAIDKKKQVLKSLNMFLSQWIEKYQEKNAGYKTYMSLSKDKLRAHKIDSKRFK